MLSLKILNNFQEFSMNYAIFKWFSHFFFKFFKENVSVIAFKFKNNGFIEFKSIQIFFSLNALKENLTQVTKNWNGIKIWSFRSLFKCTMPQLLLFIAFVIALQRKRGFCIVKRRSLFLHVSTLSLIKTCVYRKLRSILFYWNSFSTNTRKRFSVIVSACLCKRRAKRKNLILLPNDFFSLQRTAGWRRKTFRVADDFMRKKCSSFVRFAFALIRFSCAKLILAKLLFRNRQTKGFLAEF